MAVGETFRQAGRSFDGGIERAAAGGSTLSALRVLDENAALYAHGRQSTKHQ